MLIPERLVHRVDVGAVQVLVDLRVEHLIVGHVAEDDRYFLESGCRGGAPAALAGDDLEPTFLGGSHEERFEHALRLNALGQFAQPLLVEVLARVGRRRVYLRRGKQLIRRLRRHRVRAHMGVSSLGC